MRGELLEKQKDGKRYWHNLIATQGKDVFLRNSFIMVDEVGLHEALTQQKIAKTIYAQLANDVTRTLVLDVPEAAGKPTNVLNLKQRKRKRVKYTAYEYHGLYAIENHSLTLMGLIKYDLKTG